MSEIGYYNSTGGYWQTTGQPPPEVIAAYPSGTIEVPLKPGPFYDWNGAAWVENIPAPPTSGELDQLAEEFSAQLMEQSLDATRAIGLTLAEVVWRVSNSSVPENITRVQANTFVKDSIRDNYRGLL